MGPVLLPLVLDLPDAVPHGDVVDRFAARELAEGKFEMPQSHLVRSSPKLGVVNEPPCRSLAEGMDLRTQQVVKRPFNARVVDEILDSVHARNETRRQIIRGRLDYEHASLGVLTFEHFQGDVGRTNFAGPEKAHDQCAVESVELRTIGHIGEVPTANPTVGMGVGVNTQRPTLGGHDELRSTPTKHRQCGSALAIRQFGEKSGDQSEARPARTP